MQHEGMPGIPMRDRPIEEQVAVLRHDLDGLRQITGMLHEADNRHVARMDSMEAQFITTNEALRLSWAEDFRQLFKEASEEQREQRREDIEKAVKGVFSRTQKVVVWLVPFMIALNAFGSWMNWW
jgi:hypothetical protein